MSHATVVMIACDDDDKCYDILLPARSGEVETHRGFNHVAPSGILAPFDEMSPSPQKEFSSGASSTESGSKSCTTPRSTNALSASPSRTQKSSRRSHG